MSNRSAALAVTAANITFANTTATSTNIDWAIERTKTRYVISEGSIANLIV